MNLISGYPYFMIKSGLYPDYEILRSDHKNEAVILGSGISGALMAYSLTKQGISCTVVDKRKIGLGSTSASTSLLQYEIDIPLHQLEKKIGLEHAQAAYLISAGAIDRLAEIAKDIGYNDFKSCSSLYFSHRSRSMDFFKKELEARQELGLEVEYLSQKQLFAQYGLKAKEAIRSRKAAKIDAYFFTQQLHRYNQSKGVCIYENTYVESIKEKQGHVDLLTDKGFHISTKNLVYASGYEATEEISSSIVELRSTFAVVTERIPDLPSVFCDTLFWSTGDPYLYAREDNGRLIIGGRDEKNHDPQKRSRLLEKKTKLLLRDFKKFIPGVEISPAFSWAGTFGSTKDGLPYIGIYPGCERCYVALGFGGNGITFSAIAADLIAKSIKDGINRMPGYFGFKR